MQPPASWAPNRERQFAVVARSASARYAALAADLVIGLVTLPLNLAYLGTANYGLWVLLGSLTVHFSLFDLGFSGATVKFVAQYRARTDARALNEIASTVFFAFAGIGLLAYLLIALAAFNLDAFFAISAAQADVGRWLLLMIGIQIALNFPFSVFGAVVAGFQRHDINSLAAVVASVVAASVNIGLLLAGYGLVAIVAGTTAVRVLAFLVYRANAYRVYPELQVRPSLVRRARLREVTGFSVYTSIIDWANRLNYQLDSIVIGVFLGTPAVAVWAPAERIITATQRLTNQVNGILFPMIVDTDTARQQERLREIFVQGTRFSLGFVVPIAAALIVVADPLIRAWLGPRAQEVAGAIPVLQVLAVAVAIRVGGATGTTILKGAGQHRMLAFVNLATGLVNVALSVLLITRYGLLGVAYGTLIPLAISTIAVLYPAACRRVGLPVAIAVRRAVLPALWPALPAAAVLFALRGYVPATLPGLFLEVGLASAVYLALFIGVAVGPTDRALYLAKARELLIRRRREPVPPEGAAPRALAGGR
ncbi:MAG TPA: oligosaccharide flippase family protein [Vicinamibacterales bacterium]|nr:oligosaccharide flippase family protein [Vicinamibacterales bacterium]